MLAALLVLLVDRAAALAARAPPSAERVTFGAGCFWAPQEAFARTPGVLSARVGYSGGPPDRRPTYASVCAGDGHTEAVDVVYDPAVVSFDEIMRVFLEEERSVPAKPQYRGVVWTRDAAQARAARGALESAGAGARIAVEPAERLWPAERYHQDWWSKLRLRLPPLVALVAIGGSARFGDVAPPELVAACKAAAPALASLLLAERIADELWQRLRPLE